MERLNIGDIVMDIKNIHNVKEGPLRGLLIKIANHNQDTKYFVDWFIPEKRKAEIHLIEIYFYSDELEKVS
jgi:hypothetical protein